MRRLLGIMFVWVALSTSAHAEDSYWGDRSKGWFWYEDPMLYEEDKKPESPAQAIEKPKRIQDMKNAAEIRAEIQRLLDIASANPTKDNVRAFMAANKYSLDRASEFTNTWSSILRETPSLDTTIENPVNALALTTKRESDMKKRERKLTAISKTHGLFFFFRGDCKFCHAFAPTLLAFSKQYGFEVFPISVDGGSLPEYTNPSKDNGMAGRLGITTVPALFIGDKRSGQIDPIGYGVLSAYDLAERIVIVTGGSDLPK